VLYVGLDLSRKRLDWLALEPEGQLAANGAVAPDRDALAQLGRRLGDAPVLAVIESMSGARFVHDQLELAGWDVRIADAVKARGLAPLACKTDRIDCWVLAELARRNLVPEVWLPDPQVRAERERARFRLHLVKHRSALKNRVHAILFQHGLPNPYRDLFGAGGRCLLERLELPEPWASTVAASLALIDELDDQISDCERELRRRGAAHPYIPLLTTIPGIAWVLGYTIAAEIGEQPLRHSAQADRLHRPDPARRPVGRTRPPRPTAQERTQLPALGADRSSTHRRPPPPLPADRRADARPTRAHTRLQDRRNRDRPPPHRGDLAHAHQQQTVCSGRRPNPHSRMTAH
jgi:transposase